MAVRTQDCTREYLGTVPLPNHADTYTVISHEFVISNTLEQLALHGFTVADEKNKNRLSEILRMRELLVDYSLGGNIYHSSAEGWNKYFYYYNLAARNIQNG